MMVSECVGDSSDRGRCVSDCGACVRGRWKLLMCEYVSE